MKRLAVTALLLAFAVPSFAGEMYLGSTKLSHGGDVDTLLIRSCANARADEQQWDRDEHEWDHDDGRNVRRNDGRLEAFRFEVTRARAQVDRIDVMFGNGRHQSFYPRNRSFLRDESSNWFQLPGRNERCIRAITVYGQTEIRGIKSLLKKARIHFYGWE